MGELYSDPDSSREFSKGLQKGCCPGKHLSNNTPTREGAATLAGWPLAGSSRGQHNTAGVGEGSSLF